MRRTIIGLLAVMVAATAGFALKKFLDDRKQAKIDGQITADVEALVLEKFQQLGSESEIIRRYGAFESLSGEGWSRPNYLLMLVSSLRMFRRAHFKKAEARVDIVIQQGPLNASFEMAPSEKWWNEHPDWDYQVEVRNSKIWLVRKDGSAAGQSMIHISATHPQFVPRLVDLARNLWPLALVLSALGLLGLLAYGWRRRKRAA